MRIILYIAIALFASSVTANTTVGDYQKLKGMDAKLNHLYLMGVGNGLFAANTELILSRKENPIYCQPDTLTLTEDNYVSILESEINRLESKLTATTLGNSPIEMILLLGLKQTFPCSK